MRKVFYPQRVKSYLGTVNLDKLMGIAVEEWLQAVYRLPVPPE